MSISSTRVQLPVIGHLADANAFPKYSAERAAWIWHPDKSATETAFLRFRLRFTVTENISPLLHVTGDQRFQLRCDGQDITFGPDRCDKEHWTVQSVRLELSAGEHELEAVAWFITESYGMIQNDGSVGGVSQAATPPMAQMSWRAGFLLYGEGPPPSLLTTGEAPWVVEDLTNAVKIIRPQLPHYHDVGPSFSFDLSRWRTGDAKPASIVMPPLAGNLYGLRRPGWSLFPAELPEQHRAPWTGGRVRAFRSDHDDGPFQASDRSTSEMTAWQDLLTNGASLSVPPHSQWTVLWDLENYRCGYPAMKIEGGQGTLIEWSWAEALYEEARPQAVDVKSSKGHRGEIAGKVFVGFEDRWLIGPDDETETPALWWRCGRYVRIRVKTSEKPVTFIGLGLITTGYLDYSPLQSAKDFSAFLTDANGNPISGTIGDLGAVQQGATNLFVIKVQFGLTGKDTVSFYRNSTTESNPAFVITTAGLNYNTLSLLRTGVGSGTLGVSDIRFGSSYVSVVVPK